MDFLTHEVLTELSAFALLALAVALAFFGFLRMRHPEMRWHARGNVYTEPYSGLDMAVVGLILFLFLSVFLSSPESAGGAVETVEPGAGAPVESVQSEPEKPAVRSDEITPLRLAEGAMVQIILIGSLLVYLSAGRGFHLAELFGFRQKSILKSVLIAAAFMIPTIFVVKLSFGIFQVVVEETISEAPPQPMVEAFMRSESSGLRWAIFFSAVFIAPVCEEILFRGFFYPVIKRHTERIFAALFTGLVFGIIHYHLHSLLPLAVLGVVLAFAYELTGSLWVPIFMHAFFNAASTLQMQYPEVNWWW